MPNFNHCTFIGHLTRDPETRDAGSSTVTKFGVATNNPFRKDDPPLFISVEMWGKRGETIQSHFSKGDPILVSGALWPNEWTGSDGEVKKSLVLNATDFTFVGSKGGGGGSKPSNDDIPF